ncbi:hypothetical protein [Roseobacter sp.]
MHAPHNTYRGLGLLVDLNTDRMLYAAAIFLALVAASGVATTLG